jgi:hypothetical protein
VARQKGSGRISSTMKDETLLPRLTSGLSIEDYDALEREARGQWRADLDETDFTVLLRLRERYEAQLQPHRDLIVRLLVTWRCLSVVARLPYDVKSILRMALSLSDEELDALTAQEIRDNFEGLKK